MSRIDFVGLARQTAGMGTKVTTMEYYVPVETSGADANRETLEIQETVGNRFPTGIDYGTRFFDIPWTGAPRMTSLPRILSAFVGQSAVTGAGPYVHVHDPTAAGKTAEPHSLFVVRMDPDPPIVDLFWDARGNELALNIAPNDFLKMDASFIAIDLDDGQTAPTPTTDLSARRKFSEAVVSISTDDGVTFTPVASAGWGITYRNNLDTDEAVLGSRKLYALPVGNADCEVRWSPRETLNDQYRRALAVDPEQISLKLVATSQDASEQLTVLVHALEVISAPAAVSGADVLKMVEVTARAKQHPTSGKFVTFTVKNAVATYS